MEEYVQDPRSVPVHQGSVVLIVLKLLATSSVKMEEFVTRINLVSASQDFMEIFVKKGENNKLVNDHFHNHFYVHGFLRGVIAVVHSLANKRHVFDTLTAQIKVGCKKKVPF